MRIPKTINIGRVQVDAMPTEGIWTQPLGNYILMSYIKLKELYNHFCASYH